MKPIIVTGTHRSGTTWVGKVLAGASSIGYIHEPFHLNRMRPATQAEFVKYWYPIVHQNNKIKIKNHLKKLVNLECDFHNRLSHINTLRGCLHFIRDMFNIVNYRLNNKTVLIKDPFLLLMLEEVTKFIDFEVVVLIRHPAAFCDSLIRKNWTFPFSHFYERLENADTLFDGYRDKIKEYTKNKKELLDQSILLWNILNRQINFYKDKYDWVFIKHEEIARSPKDKFSWLADQVSLQTDKSFKRQLQELTKSESKNIFSSFFNRRVKRDSESQIKKWKKNLDKNSIQKIKQRTENIASNFYDESDWE